MILNHEVINCDWRGLDHGGKLYDVCFADPPDNIGLGYSGFKDRNANYEQFLKDMIVGCTFLAPIAWFSFNAKWTFMMGRLIADFLDENPEWEAKACQQIFTFGQHNKHDLGNNHRPLYRLRDKSAPLYPQAVRVPSWRQLNGDKRAAKGGRIPGDVFDFTRVTGNSSQRRGWHPTQLNEGLVERCLKLSAMAGGRVFDPFAGTGTTLRVARRIGMSCVTSDISPLYCRAIAKEHKMERVTKQNWKLREKV